MENHGNNEHQDNHDQHGHHDEHHHEESFVSKYIFSMDHKTISRQFLVTAVLMATFAMLMSMVFRLQLAWPGEKFAFINWIMGDKWGKGGTIDPGVYMALVTIHGTVMVFMVLTGGLSGTFSNLLIPLQVGARDMASGFLNMLSYWFFFL